jgi:cytochrome c peroxidase
LPWKKSDLRNGSVVLAIAATLLGCSGNPPAKPVVVDREKLKPFMPLSTVMDSPKNPLTPEKIALGRMLYYEPRLSKSQEISCNTCHPLDHYGVDNKRVSDGHRGLTGSRNTPTVYNAAGQIMQFWDGRAADVEEQAKVPMQNPLEMAMPSREEVEHVLQSIPVYVNLFQKAFPKDKNPVTFDNAALAIGAFERRLVTPSRFDLYLDGVDSALNDDEKVGLIKFVDVGCVACHTGRYLGGTMYQKIGLVKPYPNTKDQGHFEVTGKDVHRMWFKVPSLRNIDKTAPYFHDGSVTTLEHAVQLMSDYQLERPLTHREVQQVSTFLRSLTGEIPVDYIKAPMLPPSSDKTPKPDNS